jgi:hypothetical protein
MRPLHEKLRVFIRLWRNKRGSTLVIAAAAMPVLIGVAGLGADAGLWYVNKRVAQTQADAAAVSGAFERAKFSPGTVTEAARKEAIRNGFQNTAPNQLTILNPPTSGPNAGDIKAVEVILTARQPLLFAKLFLDEVLVRTRAVAAVQTTGTACVLALDPTASSALTSSGSSIVNMPGCVMAANSSSSTAIDIGGSTQVTAESLWTVGNYTQGGSGSISLAKPPVVNAWAIDDPYADLQTPLVGACDKAVPSGSVVTVTPGTYCGFSVGSGQTVTFEPGTYYINHGDFTVNSTGTVRCNCPGTSGVTIVLTTDQTNLSSIGTVTINGGADVQLKAPSDGSTYSGVAFYQDPRAPAGNPPAKFNGGANMNITGAVYFPNRQIQWNGNNSPSGPSCTQLVGRTVMFNGNATINNTGCPEAGVAPITITGVRIVE